MTWFKKGFESGSETNFSTNTNSFHVPAFLLHIWEEMLEMPTIIPFKKGKRKKK